MKKILYVLFFCPMLVMSQAKKPTLMVLPSDAWCTQQGFIQEFQDEGRKVVLPDLERAVNSDMDLLSVIAKINGLLADRGFPAKALDQELKSLSTDNALDDVGMSRDGGSVLESPIDKLYKHAQSDIIIQVQWKVNKTGPKNSVKYTLRALDAYTNKEVATVDGTGEPSFEAEISRLLEEAIIAHMDNFSDRLQRHFEDMFENGREITLRIRIWDSWGQDLYEEYGDSELGEIIEDWLAENSVKGRFSTTTYSDTYMYFEQVRMPMFDDRNRAIDARRWARELQKFLQDAPYNIPSRLDTRGLGQATLTLGSK
ncbi:MAG: DUF6175 family protein [Bacteroidia bacterium]